MAGGSAEISPFVEINLITMFLFVPSLDPIREKHVSATFQEMALVKKNVWGEGIGRNFDILS